MPELVLNLGEDVPLQFAKGPALDSHCFHRLADPFEHRFGSPRRVVSPVSNVIVVLVAPAPLTVRAVDLVFCILEQLSVSQD